MSQSTNNSSESGQQKKVGEKVPRKASSTGKKAKDIMSRHIKDQKDVITDEEFKNLNIEAEITGETAHEPLEIPVNPNHPKDEDKDPKVITPWDVIN
jgi:hypothetical protein